MSLNKFNILLYAVYVLSSMSGTCFCCYEVDKLSMQSFVLPRMSSFKQLTCFGFLLPRWSLNRFVFAYFFGAE